LPPSGVEDEGAVLPPLMGNAHPSMVPQSLAVSLAASE
jgi:hypothetical protein